MSRKVAFSLITAFLLTLVAGIYINKVYFFNPLTFKKDGVTFLSWSEYKKPLEIQFFIITKEDGWRISKVTDQKEIRFIIKELKNGNDIEEIKDYSRDPNMIGMTILSHGIEKIPGTFSESGVLHQFTGYENGNAFKIGNGVWREFTDKLRELVDKRLKEAL